MENSIEVRNVNFSYNNKDAVLNNISLTIEKNTVMGLLGPNGAGKTTLLECMQGLINIKDGDITIEGINVKTDKDDIKRIMGVQFQSNKYFDYIKVKEIFEFFACLYDIDITKEQIDNLLESVSLIDKKESYVSKLSGGQKQKVSIALSIMNNPKVLFLDEPTTGLDPQSRKELWDIIKEIKEKGTTIILTTHYMEEVEVLCDKVCFINNGYIYDIDSPENIIKKSNIDSIIHIEKKGELTPEKLKRVPEVNHIILNGNNMKIYTQNANLCINNLYDLSKKENFEIVSISTHKANLEDVFLQITGRGL